MKGLPRPSIRFARRRSFACLAVISLILCASIATTAADLPSAKLPAIPARSAPFILGADIMYLPEDEFDGAIYYDGDVKKDFFQILKDNRLNYVRVTVMVDPALSYSRGKAEAFMDLAHLKVVTKRAKAAGIGVLLDFFYADTWANPEGYPKPAAWAKLPFPDLVQALHAHTKGVLTALKEQGTLPDMVQIGNEVTFGMLWPDGRVTSTISTGNPETDAHNANVTDAGGWDHLATLLKAGIAATKEVDPSIKIMLHHSLARNDALVHEWLDNLEKHRVPFDIVGLSCYAQHQPDDWKTTFEDIARNYPHLSFIAVEYRTKARFLNDLVFHTSRGAGLGTFLWEPTRPPDGIFDQTPGSSPAGKKWGGRFTANALMKLFPEMARDYGNVPAATPAANPQ